jgi:hypothetical protein
MDHDTLRVLYIFCVHSMCASKLRAHVRAHLFGDGLFLNLLVTSYESSEVVWAMYFSSVHVSACGSACVRVHG